MATRRIPILNSSCIPDTSGNVWFEPASVNFGANDIYKHLVAAFADTATKDVLHGIFRVPPDYVGSAKIVLEWATAVTTGNVRWDFDYRAVADGESLDQNTPHQESVDGGDVATPATARLRKSQSLTLTSANLVANDLVQFLIGRDGVNETSGVAGNAYLFGAWFEYADV